MDANRGGPSSINPHTWGRGSSPGIIYGGELSISSRAVGREKTDRWMDGWMEMAMMRRDEHGALGSSGTQTRVV
jgi:hypothetical protein